MIITIWMGLLFITVWFGCGVLTYGFDFAHFQRKYPYLAERDRRSDRISSVLVALLGPLGLILVMIAEHNKHGLKFK